MGGKGSKTQSKGKNKAQVEEEEPNKIALTSDIFISESKNDPYSDYVRVKFLGEGSFAKVCKVKHKITGAIRAMKIISKSSSASNADDIEILNEINVLKRMDHPNILKIFEFYVNRESYFLVTELCGGGEWFKEIIDKGPFSERNAAYVMYQIFSSINYCHNMKIIHRDLKPENILIECRENDGWLRVKVCDFGTSKMFEKGSVQKKIVGSSYYIAPEVWNKKYNEKCDLWSCGVILYILLSGRPPFGGENDQEIIQSVKSGKFDMTRTPWDTISKDACSWIKSLLVTDSSKRISAESALQSNWLIKNKSKELFNEIKDKDMIERFIRNWKEYKCESIIQETALAYLVHNNPQMDDIVNACKWFNQIDISGDGKINEDELYSGWSKRISSSTWKEDVKNIFKNIDADNNKYIEYEEFVRAAIDKEMFWSPPILQFAFRYFDKDGSGEISYEEIEEVFKSSMKKGNVHESLMKIIAEVDTNGDGSIDFEEFCAIMGKMWAKGD